MSRPQPQIDPTAFVAPSADVHGDVRVGPDASIWFQAVARAELAPITIGARSNVQDGTIIHTDFGFPCTIGEGVTVGHSVVLHGCTIGDGALIGIGAIVLNGARVGEGAIVAAGALVPEGADVPPGMVVMGTPAKVARSVRDAERERAATGADHYVENAARYRAG